MLVKETPYELYLVDPKFSGVYALGYKINKCNVSSNIDDTILLLKNFEAKMEERKKEYAEKNPLQVFEDVYSIIADRKIHPKEGSYTNYLFDKGIDKILKKVGEEATEIVIAAKNPDSDELKYEICDFLYHMMVLMAERDVTWKEITRELAERH